MARRMHHVNTQEKVKDFKGTLKKLIGYIKIYKVAIILTCVFALLATVFSIIGPDILGNATTEIFNGLFLKITGNGSMNFEKIRNTLLILLGFAILIRLKQ